MTRTRPGSIIRECYNASLYGRRADKSWPAAVSTIEHTGRHVTRHQVTTTQGCKIRSWIVVKE